jgi:hypothetical protein
MAAEKNTFCYVNFSSFLIFLLVIPGFSIYQPTEENPWEFRKEQEGVKVYSRAVRGSNIREVQAFAVLDFPIEIISCLLNDIPGQAQWMPDVLESRLLEDDPLQPVQYTRIGAPRPVSDRDVVIISFIRQSEDRVVRSFHSTTHKDAPPKRGITRIPQTSGSWLLESVDGQKTKVTYQIHSDPGAHCPDGSLTGSFWISL